VSGEGGGEKRGERERGVREVRRRGRVERGGEGVDRESEEGR
jgi:hypothetical protein